MLSSCLAECRLEQQRWTNHANTETLQKHPLDPCLTMLDPSKATKCIENQSEIGISFEQKLISLARGNRIPTENLNWVGRMNTLESRSIAIHHNSLPFTCGPGKSFPNKFGKLAFPCSEAWIEDRGQIFSNRCSSDQSP